MVSLGNPKTWVPYMDTKDCSQGFCSLYCPQWCYIIFPPPPPIKFTDESSSSSFSPLVIAIIGILASAFLLMSYYTIISKYCGKMESSRRENHNPDVELEDNHNPSLHGPWNVTTTGLDETLIKSITVCKYKKGDGLIEGTDCSVCLNEFEENECLRLLPKCSHAFHLQCIDTWLKFHSNCPMCRANIVSITPMLYQLHPAVSEIHVSTDQSSGDTQIVNENAAFVEDSEMGIMHNVIVPKSPLRVFSDLGNSADRDIIIEIGNEEHQHIRRSFSMSYVCQNQVSVADILQQNEDDQSQELEFPGEAGSSKQSTTNRGLHYVSSPVRMKRSFSSGRFLFSKHGRLQKGIIPVRSFVSKKMMRNN